MDELLRRTAERVAEHPEMMASVLLRFARLEELDDAAIAERVGCGVDQLPELLWCRRPSAGRFRQDLELLAERFQLNAGALAGIIRHMDALDELAGESAAPNLLAARDRESDEEAEDGR